MIQIDVHLGPEEARAQMVRDVRQGLARPPRELPPRWFYDPLGCELYERITRSEEYYLTRAESEILAARAAQLTRAVGPLQVTELGAGASEKSRMLMRAAWDAGARRYVPFDVSLPSVREAAARLEAEFPELSIHGVVGDFAAHLPLLPRGPRQLVAFLGSTIGNFFPEERARFLRQVRALPGEGGAFLLGADLVKEPRALCAAYDDAQGITAAFNKNLLTVLNRELGADFDLQDFDHQARWDAAAERMEMHLVARRPLRAAIPGASMEVALGRGESIRTEISAKFTRRSLEQYLAEANFQISEWHTDAAGRFALVLARPV